MKKNALKKNDALDQRTDHPSAQAIKLRSLLQNRLKHHIAAHQSHQNFGLPLMQQLGNTSTNQDRKKPSTMSIVGAVIGTASTIGVLLAAIQRSWGLATIAAVSFGISVRMIIDARSKSAGSNAEMITSPALFDAASLLAFDQTLASINDELGSELRAQLIAFKQQIYRLCLLAQHSEHLNSLPLESRHYLNQSLLRYLPDSLQSYLRIPAAIRNTQIIDQNCTAEQLLIQQIGLLQEEFDKYEREFHQNAAEELIQQQRFLEMKRQEQDTA